MFGCERTDKFGIFFTKDGGLVKCMRCGESTSLIKYLIFLNRKDLIGEYSAPILDELKCLEELEQVEEKEEQEQVEVKLPDGFKRIYFDEYLEERNWESSDYNKYKVGVSTERKLRNHIIYPIYQNGVLSSWLARSRMDKDWHKQNIKDFKSGEASLVLRYYNSEGTEFSNLVGNLDSVVEGVDHTVILVEGIFDEQNISKYIKHLDLKGVKCCFTFGKSLSENQINLLLNKGISNFVLMYDPDALHEIEKYLLNYSSRINIEGISLDKEDPGDLPDKETFLKYYNNRKQTLEFYQTNIKRIV